MLNRLYLVCPWVHQAYALASPFLGNEIARYEPGLTVWEPIIFTHLTVTKEKSLKQGVGKTQDGQALRPEPGKSLIIPARQKSTIQKGGMSTVFQDLRYPALLVRSFEPRFGNTGRLSSRSTRVPTLGQPHPSAKKRKEPSPSSYHPSTCPLSCRRSHQSPLMLQWAYLSGRPHRLRHRSLRHRQPQ